MLLTIGNGPGGACHGCPACLSAYVLARADSGLNSVDEATDFGQAGTSGDPGHISAVRIFRGHSYAGLDFHALHAGRVVHVEASPRVALSASIAMRGAPWIR